MRPLPETQTTLRAGKERAWPRSPNCGQGAADSRADYRTQDGPSGAGRRHSPCSPTGLRAPLAPAGHRDTLPHSDVKANSS